MQIAAVESLVLFDDPEIPRLIFELTKSQDLEVMKAAITGIGETKQNRYGVKIQSFLNHSDWGVRAAAARSLGRLKDSSARSKLEDLEARDPDRLVSRAAQFALSQINES